MVSKVPLFLQSTWKGGQWAGRWEAQQSMGSSPEQQQHGKASRLTRVALQAWEQGTALPRSWARIRGSSRAQEAGQPHQAPRPTSPFSGTIMLHVLRECPRLKNTHAYSIAEPGRHPPAQLN